VKRGELWTVAGGSEFLSKPRPAILIQISELKEFNSATLCPLSSGSPADHPCQVHIEPSNQNGLNAPSVAKADMITTVRISRLGRHIGSLNAGKLAWVERASILCLGLENSI
jgi:mRNA interferase MazF